MSPWQASYMVLIQVRKEKAAGKINIASNTYTVALL